MSVEFLKVEDLAEMLQVSPRQVIALCKSEDSPLPHVRIGGRSPRFRKSDVDNWFSKNLQNPISV